MSLCLSVRDLAVVREKNKTRFVLKVPELDIHSGQILAVVGHSGCGKSTLLDTLALVLTPHSATSFLFHDGQKQLNLQTASKNALADLRRCQLGYILQSGGLLPFLSVADNIYLAAQLAEKFNAETMTFFDYLVRKLKIDDQINKRPQSLSGGQRQRVAIARALLHKPRIILADEPTAAVDQEMAIEICQTLRELAKQLDIAVVIVSHDLELVRSIADRQVGFKLKRFSDLNVESYLS